MILLFLIILVVLIITWKCFQLLNQLIIRTNWYRNIFILSKDFETATYVKEHSVKLDIVNVGSNPARFSLFYADSNGLNLSTGTQSLDLDLKILKHYSESIGENTYVLLPLVLFSSISAYLEKYPPSLFQYARLCKILSIEELENKTLANRAKKFIKYPLYFFPKSIKYLVRDVRIDNRLYQGIQRNQHIDMMRNAERWIRIWTDEFQIENLEAPLSGGLLEARKKSIEIFKEILDYCLSKKWKPIIVSPPISKELGALFTPAMKEIYVDSFVREFSYYNIPYLDYIYDERFSDSSLYMDALFMNLEGRKLFTKDVLNRIL